VEFWNTPFPKSYSYETAFTAEAVKETVPLLSVLTIADKVRFDGAVETFESLFLLHAARIKENKKEKDISFMFVVFTYNQSLLNFTANSILV
jgi:hypothetical protein